MRLLLSPHSDDECLFAAYTIMRHKPLVVVCTKYDGRREATANQRMVESVMAMDILGAKCKFLHILESEIGINLRSYIVQIVRDNQKELECIYAPAKQGGHPHHDMVNDFAHGVAGHIVPIIEYATYTKDNLKPSGDIEIAPTDEEFELKKRALACYKSQWKLNPQHFEAVLEARSEFYIS